LRDAASEVFLNFGYEKAKLGEIVKRAASSKETLNAQYANKQELFKAAICKNLEGPFVQLELLVAADLCPCCNNQARAGARPNRCPAADVKQAGR
jgi:hypothetical protein